MKKTLLYLVVFMYFYLMGLVAAFVVCSLIYTGCILIFDSPFYWRTPLGFAFIIVTVFCIIGNIVATVKETVEKIERKTKK